MINNLKIQLDELEFHGLIFRKTNKYKNYPQDYWDKLLEEGTHYSKIKYLESLDGQMIESIHFKLSYYYLLFTIALVILSLSIILLFQRLLLLAIILFITFAIFYFVGWLFQRSARNENMSMAMNRPMIDLIFEEHKKIKSR